MFTRLGSILHYAATFLHAVFLGQENGRLHALPLLSYYASLYYYAFRATVLDICFTCRAIRFHYGILMRTTWTISFGGVLPRNYAWIQFHYTLLFHACLLQVSRYHWGYYSSLGLSWQQRIEELYRTGAAELSRLSEW